MEVGVPCRYVASVEEMKLGLWWMDVILVRIVYRVSANPGVSPTRDYPTRSNKREVEAYA